MIDLEDLEYVRGSLKLLGSKGTTGTQASFLELFEGDQEKCDRLDPMIAEKMGFASCYPVSGQTYSRKVDTRVLNVLSGIAASATKFSNDIRLLQHMKEIEEPFEKKQIGSSAMLTIAESDGEIEPEEQKVLEEVGRRLGLRVEDYI